MARSTQYIGLNAMAQEFVNTLTLVSSDNHTLGMFDEVVPLGEYIHPDGTVYREVVQCEPWSSGPMIFTCLEDSDGNKLFSWVSEFMEHHEVDYERCRFYV